MTTTYKRRSDRMNLTVPIAVEGMDAQGQPFKDEAQALVISGFGGRIRLGRHLARGQQLLVVGPRDPSPAVFEVVETVVPPSSSRGEYGVVCLDRAEDFWGIRFWGEPDTPAEAKALLECQMCRTVGYVPLALTQVDALRYMGFVGLPCTQCKATTPWGYHDVQQSAKLNSAEGEAAVGVPAENRTPRNHRRIYAEFPIQVSSGETTEVTHTENVSRSGLSFISSRQYEAGDPILVRCPFDPTNEIPPRWARVIDARPVKGSGNTIYGVAFEPRR